MDLADLEFLMKIWFYPKAFEAKVVKFRWKKAVIKSLRSTYKFIPKTLFFLCIRFECWHFCSLFIFRMKKSFNQNWKSDSDSYFQWDKRSATKFEDQIWNIHKESHKSMNVSIIYQIVNVWEMLQKFCFDHLENCWREDRGRWKNRPMDSKSEWKVGPKQLVHFSGHLKI